MPEEKSGLTDEAKAEIQAAIKILREDGIHIHKTYKQFMASMEEKDPPKVDDKTKEGDPPPEKEEPNEQPKKKGLWWGDKGDD